MSIDLEILRKLKEEAQISRKKRAREAIARARMVPIVYVPTGTTLLRFYMDSESKVMRTFLRHKRERVSVPCLGDGCEVCRYLGEMGEKYPNLPGAWRLYPTEITIAYGWIFSCSVGDTLAKIGTPVLLMGDYKLAQELDDQVARMDEEALGKMLDPSADHVLWELRSYDRRLSLAPTSETRTMNPLPKNLYPLKLCIHPEGQAPTREQVSKFIEIIDDAYGAYIGTAA